MTNADLDAGARERRKHRVIEMQSGGGGGRRSGMARVDGLVALGIRFVRGARDVRRQRHLAVALQILVERFDALEAQAEEAAIALDDGGAHSAGQQQNAARMGRMARAKLEHGFVRAKRAFEQQLDFAARRAQRVDPRPDHARVVENDQIAAREKPRQLGESTIGERCARHVQQPASAARFGRCLSDQLRRQRIVEIGQRERGHSVLHLSGAFTASGTRGDSDNISH